MRDTFYDGDIVFVSKLEYILSKPKKSDVVIAVEPQENTRVIKRIEATGNNPVVYQKKPILLKKDEVFICGDNEKKSYDSRFYGPVSTDRLMGKVICGIGKRNGHYTFMTQKDFIEK